MQFRACWSFNAAHIMAGGKAICPKLACQPEQVGKLHAHVAPNARNGCPARHIFIGKMVDDRFAKLAFMIEHIMRDPQFIGNGARVPNILPRAAGTGAFYRAAMVI